MLKTEPKFRNISQIIICYIFFLLLQKKPLKQDQQQHNVITITKSIKLWHHNALTYEILNFLREGDNLERPVDI